MSVEDLLTALHQEAKRRAYIRRLEVLDWTSNLLKARLYPLYQFTNLPIYQPTDL